MSKSSFDFLSPQQAPPGAVSCPHCHQPVRFVSELAGMPVPCPHCRKQLIMPGQSMRMPAPQVYQQASPYQSRPTSTPPSKLPARKKHDPTLLFVIAGVLGVVMLGATVYALSEMQSKSVKHPARQAVKVTPEQQRKQMQALAQMEAELAREQQQQILQQQALQEQLQMQQNQRAAARAQQNFRRALPGGPGRGFRP